MMNIDMLNCVKANLEMGVGQLRLVAQETEIPYDTILRIKNGEGDPGYSKVKTLFDYYTKVGTGEVVKKVRA